MNIKITVLFFTLGLAALLTATAVGQTPTPQKMIIRWPAVAEGNYPAEPEKLLSTVKGYFEEAQVPEVSSRLSAVIAAPAPYQFAGAISAHAFKSLQPGQYERIIIIAPGHGVSFENCSIPAVDTFITPLGPVALDASAIHYILYSPIMQSHQIDYDANSNIKHIHEFEFAIETLLPFLQERLQEFKLVPILVGELTDSEGIVRENTIAAIADTIRPIINERTLVVVSSSFTQYGAAYNNVPFTDNIAENIARLDRLAFEPLLKLDLHGFRSYLNETDNMIDGKYCIQILMKLLPPNARARILAYETSAAVTNDDQDSVSYAAFTFHDPSKPALSAQPDKVRPLVLRRPRQMVKPPTETEKTDPDKKNSLPTVPPKTE
ncbi:MAG: AmmeMemoRadiSam system protein B [Candidatus Hydrogenedentes bacterium]|nr:AmmeMemoRadiSam system protein B [Candidatus Hydrogenedentota bacterium]